LLEGLANLPDGAAGFSWFKKGFPHVFSAVNPWLIRHWAMNTEQEDYNPSRSDEELMLKYWLLPLRETLRGLWRIQDARTKEWGMVRISQDFFLQGERSLIHVPLASPSDLLLTMKPPERTEQLLLQFLKVATLTRFCGNLECTAPYFVAAKRSLKYCSDLCAERAQREHKRTWWAENGQRWRAARVRHKT
jgi:hypothetical protein